MAGLTFDAGALIAAERNERNFWGFWKRTVPVDRTIPAVVIAQAWRGPRSARVAMVINGCRIEPVDEFLAKAAGELLSRSGTSDAIDAIVVVSAARRGDVILTTDPDDLRRLAAVAQRRVTIIGI